MALYMLDTDTCSFIIRKHTKAIIDRLELAVQNKSRIVISIITYSEMRYGLIGSKHSVKIEEAIDDFVKLLDGILPWTVEAVNKTVEIRKKLARLGTPIGKNDSSIAGHAIVTDSILVTNNTREFSRVDELRIENWLL